MTEQLIAQIVTMLPEEQKADNNNPVRIALVGIGQELRGDDAVGIEVVRQFKNLQSSQKSHPNIIWFPCEAGSIPENASGLLRRFQPHLVVFVDAAQMNTPGGSLRLLSLDEIDGMSASTHSLPLSVIGKYLARELNCPIALIGIQPLQNEFGSPLSEPVRLAAIELAAALSRLAAETISVLEEVD